MNRISVLGRYFRNDRIKEYEEILKSATEHGYIVTSLEKYMGIMSQADIKVLVLRHDVDHRSGGTRLMFEAEKKYGVHASYYFRKSTLDYSLMQDINHYGSEASFHFETIAEYAILHGIESKKDLPDSWQKDCLGALKSDLQYLRSMYRLPIRTIASHGAAENNKIGISNNVLTEYTSTYNELGILVEAYNSDMIDTFEKYVSDTVIECNDGYRYGESPLQLIKQDVKRICFLSHPNHWHYNKFKQIKKLVKSLIYPPTYNVEKFKRIKT